MIPEYKIGDIFNYKGITLKVELANGNSCNDCYFDENRKCITDNFIGECYKIFRNDRKNVIFKQIK